MVSIFIEIWHNFQFMCRVIFKAALALARSLLRIAFVVVVLLLLSAVVRKKAVNVSQIVKMGVRDCQNQN